MKFTEEQLNIIKNKIGAENVKTEEPMKAHTTMKVGGPAAYFFTPFRLDDLVFLVKYLKDTGMPYYVLGNGSNVIVRDEGYDGAIICLKENWSGVQIEECEEVKVTVKAGTLNKDLADELIENSITGFEFASGIPGSVGGATAMNAGAYDGEIKNIVKSVKLLNKSGEILEKSNDEMDFGYRHSLVSNGDYIVLETTFAMKKGNREKIQSVVDELTRRREDKQPLEFPSCGSTFKRPVGFFAGKLISDAGLKGYTLGGAQVSEKHAGFILNRYDGSAKDVLDLIEYVKGVVHEQFGVELECEVKIL